MRLTKAISAAALAVCLLVSPTPALAQPGSPNQGTYSFAVIGDVPYGDAQVALFPQWVQEINADPTINLTVHVGDIKNGSSRCDDAYYRQIKADFDTFRMPLIYTPGDNEWTDCHRPNNGGYNPLERLAFDRSVFFTKPGTTLGQKPMKVASQASLGLPENVMWREAKITMTAVHVVGSNNSLLPWTGNTTATPEQVAEEKARMAASIALVREAFAQASAKNDRGVAIFLQADMFDPTYTPKWSDISAFKPLIQAIVDESAAFDGQVYLFDGDSHVFNVDHPLASGSRWLTTYGITGSADNLTRITVDGSNNNRDWLKVTVNRNPNQQLLTIQQVPYQH